MYKRIGEMLAFIEIFSNGYHGKETVSMDYRRVKERE
jgi:hypothetical protein